jgi:aminopeptidase YwaD
MQQDLQNILGTVAADARLWRDFNAICDCGGRLAGSTSETRALELALTLLREIDPRSAHSVSVAYAGWRSDECSLQLLAGDRALACKPLLGSQSTSPAGLAAEVLDLGRGTPGQFEQHAREVAGRIVLVRHEYPFAAGHLHRRRKYGWAMERGAAAFIIASPFPGGGVVSGSSGRGGESGIPAVATDYESAALLAAHDGRLPQTRLTVRGVDAAAETDVTLIEIAGQTSQWVVVSAHLDGHDLAESALDNATGMAVALTVARALAPRVARCRRGLKVCLFSAEEWALAGSSAYLDRMSQAEREAIALNINLDTVGGDTGLTALVSEFAGLERFVRAAAAASGVPLGVYRPMMPNSDHYNFARHGIPALRLVAGFDAPQSNVRHILTPADTRDKVAPEELKTAARLTAALAWRALNAPDVEMAALK